MLFKSLFATLLQKGNIQKLRILFQFKTGAEPVDPAGPPPGLLCVVTTWGAWVGGFALSAGGREVERAEELAPQVPGAALTQRWTGLGAQPAFSPQADPPGACAPQSLQWTMSQLPQWYPPVCASGDRLPDSRLGPRLCGNQLQASATLLSLRSFSSSSAPPICVEVSPIIQVSRLF